MDTRNSQVRGVIQEVAGHSLTRRANVIGDACIRLEGRLRPPPCCSHPEGCVDGHWHPTPDALPPSLVKYPIAKFMADDPLHRYCLRVHRILLSRFVANVSGPCNLLHRLSVML